MERYKHNNETGFSLVEMMVTLTIFSIMSSIVLFTFVPLFTEKKTEYFLEQLSNDLHQLQMHAITHQRTVHFRFDHTNKRYYAYTNSIASPILHRFYDNNISINYGTLGPYFSFLSSGNISRFGTIFIKDEKSKYKIVFMIGKGRFYAEEL
jgi:competence protein ComGD